MNLMLSQMERRYFVNELWIQTFLNRVSQKFSYNNLLAL
jgi:hypothetical protein